MCLGFYCQQGNTGNAGTPGCVEMVFPFSYLFILFFICMNRNHRGPGQSCDPAVAQAEETSWRPAAHPYGSHLGLLFQKENSRGKGHSWEPSSSWWAVNKRGA